MSAKPYVVRQHGLGLFFWYKVCIAQHLIGKFNERRKVDMVADTEFGKLQSSPYFDIFGKCSHIGYIELDHPFLLESQLNIYLVDLVDNIIDTGTDYVIVDLGR